MSHESIDDLYNRWQGNPNAAATTALCHALRGSRRADLVEIVGSYAARQLDVTVLLAAARMYADADRLDDAQNVLIAAGRLAPRDGEVYRSLGDILLRRGDAGRAEKVLERAVHYGADASAERQLEHVRARLHAERTAGIAAPSERVAPPHTSHAHAPPEEHPRPRERLVPAESDEDLETQIRKAEDVRTAMNASLAARPAPLPAAGRPPSQRNVPVAPRSERALPEPSDAEQAPGNQTRDNPLGDGRESGDFRSPRMASQPQIDAPSHNESSASIRGFGGVANAEPPRPPMVPMLPMSRREPAPTAEAEGALIPEPRDVLDALQIAGVYEVDGAVGPQAYTWTKPEGVRRLFGIATLIALAVVLVGGGIGTYQYVTATRAKQHLESEQILSHVDKDLAASDAALLEPIEKSLARSFALESRSPHAALSWLHERALVGLLKGGADVAFEDSTERAKAVGIEDKKIAFANVASFLFQGDTAGAAATVAKWDSPAGDEAWFQLLAGATFERAGDPRAVARYATAVKLDPELIIAQILLTRATAIDGDPARAASLAKEFHSRYPNRPEGPALVALAWTRDPLRGEPPPEVKEAMTKGDHLPLSLRSVPHAASAILTLQTGSVDAAKPSLQKGLELADSPGVAAWLGGIALVMGDEVLARKAALSAISFSAVYPPARVLAARVALLGARLDEAMKASEDLSPSAVDVAIVTAAVSYEKVDGERMSRAFEALPNDMKTHPMAMALVRGQSLLNGHVSGLATGAILDMADDEAPWSDLVAMDWALDTGDIDLGKKIAERWRGEPRAMRAVRLARLARYDGRLEDADRYSKLAIETGTVTMRVLAERIFTLVALKRDADAIALFKTYPNVGGPLAKWLRAYATAAHGKIDEARAIVSQEDPPPAAAAMPSRVIAASAYAMMKDTRHGSEYTKPIVLAGFTNPDVAFAADKLGLGKIGRRAK